MSIAHCLTLPLVNAGKRPADLGDDENSAIESLSQLSFSCFMSLISVRFSLNNSLWDLYYEYAARIVVLFGFIRGSGEGQR
jgi:hypothetical protein